MNHPDPESLPDVGERLDARLLPPPIKHSTIFRTFDALAEGASFTLHNDHDPVPLRYQLEATRPGSFEWDYLEAGPELWRVRIGKKAQ